MSKYDLIGKGYAHLRRPDPRIAEAIHMHLDDARSVVNVGAGSGSYEPVDREVVAVEPSSDMIAQREAGAAPAIQASAEALPFGDDSFDAAMAVLTIHHWSNQAKGLRELRRIARDKVVLVTFDPASRPWLTEYLPQLAQLDESQMPSLDFYSSILGEVDVHPLPVPHDCSDGFLYAYWSRPEAYLDPALRAGSSSFWALPGIEGGLLRLERDLHDGTWKAHYGHLASQAEYDAGYRIVVSR
tara:strand:+ start:47152 stop:47877 length:726 start_codon:yes stop_codon:yes gene_type:complete